MTESRNVLWAAIEVGPILMSGPMVRTVLDDRKTNTRRLAYDDVGKPTKWLKMHQRFETAKARGEAAYRELLWVRETWADGYDYDDDDMPSGELRVFYGASNEIRRWYDTDRDEWRDSPRWKSPMHMPRWASRLTLEVTSTKLERLQDISEEDAIAEGLNRISLDGGGTWYCGTVDDWFWDEWRLAFAKLWDDLHGPDAWARNPLVVAITFRVHKANVHDVLKRMAA